MPWAEDRSGKPVLVDSNELHQKALNLYEGVSKGCPELSDAKPFPARKGWSHKFRNRFGLKNIKGAGEVVSAQGEPAATFLPEWKKSLRVWSLLW